MKVSRNEMVRIRKNLLRQMDTFIRENISEDVVIDVWLACGLEDGWDDEILTEYARLMAYGMIALMLVANVVRLKEFYKIRG